MDQFIDITIAEFDDKASEPSGRGALQRLVFKLSQRAPGDWADYFNQAWGQHLYMMKRQASVSGDRLQIECMPDEMKSDHLPELNKVIAETNRAYRSYWEQQQRQKQARAEAEKQRQAGLADLKKSLKFD